MRRLVVWTCFVLILGSQVFPQSYAPTFKAEVRNAFVWGEDAPAGAISSTVKDPLTGTEVLKLKHNDVEINSRMGFEKLRPEDVAEFIIYSTTIVNNTPAELLVEQGGITIDGHLVSPLSIDFVKGAKKKLSKEATHAVDVRNLHCFTSGNLPGENFLSKQPPSSGVIVKPQSSLTVSNVIKDPRHYPILCSEDGCFPKGTIRYSIRAGGHDYIFSWNGRSVMNCGL